MKIKTVRDKKTDESTLTIRLTKGEEFNYAQAELLRTLHDSPFLPFSYSTEKDGTTLLSYDISDTITLQTYLGAELSRDQFRALMIDVAQTVEACANNGFSYTELVFELNSVYMDPETNHMKWAFVPAALPGSKRASIQDLLRFIATKAKFVRKEDKPCSESLLDFLKRQTIFSLVDFKSFIDSGELKTSSGASVTSLNRGDSSDATTGGMGSGSMGSGRLGSGRLGSSPLGSGQLGGSSAGAGTYDFVKAQAGAISAEETRASKSLAEQVSFDVADVAIGFLNATGAANWDDVSQHTTFTAAPVENPAAVAPTPSAPMADPVVAAPMSPAPTADPIPVPPPPGAAPVSMPPPAASEPVNLAPPAASEPVDLAPPAASEPVLMPPPASNEPVPMPPPGSSEPVPMPPPPNADPISAYPPPAAGPVVSDSPVEPEPVPMSVSSESSQDSVAPAAVEPSASMAPPVAVEPQASMTPPVATEPPASMAPPVAIEPPANTTPPMTVEPQASMTPPASIEPPASMTPPVAIEPPSASDISTGSFSGGLSGSLASKVAPSPVAPSTPRNYRILRVATGERYSLAPERETTIGRSKRCDIRIAGNTNISRVHALLKACDEGCYVMDQQTTNKTLVNGRELAPQTAHLAQPGDEIKLADECLRLEAV